MPVDKQTRLAGLALLAMLGTADLDRGQQHSGAWRGGCTLVTMLGDAR